MIGRAAFFEQGARQLLAIRRRQDWRPLTDYLRDLSKRLETIACGGGVVDWDDITQLHDLAETLDDDRKKNLSELLADWTREGAQE